ncbi:channel protein TolC [Novosphingobium endophyticum]|uniref:Channel protein TolC n=1 Tax=Novosphingobium endophyticum TaxID=1955250 RepID=A0A916TRE9_9SPHN|nr:TolC family protein [Novosphingobium endophyticum]GGB96023.1 channel protein TolC [Novosphingobium endophyticum]
MAPHIERCTAKGFRVKFIALLRLVPVLFAVLPLPAARADTLEEAVRKAYDNNPGLAGNRALTRAADELVTQAKGAYGPSLTLSASHDYSLRRTAIEDSIFEEEGFGTTASVTLSQPIFTSGRLASGLDAARAGRMVARENLRAGTQQLILDVVSAYASLRRDIALYGVAKEIHGLLRQQRDVTLARFRLRDSTQPDVDQTDNRLQIAARRVIVARAAVEASAARYRNLVGTYPERLEPLPALPDPPTLETLYVEAEAHNPALPAARFTERRSRAAVAAARAAMGPQVSVFATGQRAPVTPYQNTNHTESIVAGVGVTMPLNSGGQLSAAVREATQRNLADQQFTEQTRRDMRETLATDWNLYRAASEALPRYQAAVRAAESAVAGVKQQETSGIRTLRDVLDVTNDLLTARTSAAETQAELYIRKAAVLRDTGLLTIGLFSDEAAYDPDSYRPTASVLAGLPLRPALDPIDRLLRDSHVRPTRIEIEDSAAFEWEGTHDAAPQPPR